MRTYAPRIETVDGSFSLDFTNPDYRPITAFSVEHRRRQEFEVVARRDGGRIDIPGRLDVMEVNVEGSFGSADGDANDALRDEVSGALLRQDQDFYIYKYDDRRATVRLLDTAWPMGRVIMRETPYRLRFLGTDPYWYDLTSGELTGPIIMNGDPVVLNIGGSAPTPLSISLTMPDTTEEISWIVGMEDADQSARTGEGWWRFGDTTFALGPNDTITVNAGERTITCSDAECEHPLERFNGYFFTAGPGDVHLQLKTDDPLDDMTATVQVTWTSRWYLP